MKYKVTYRGTDGDCCSVWTQAANKQAAAEEVKHEYWDCKEIIDIEPIY